MLEMKGIKNSDLYKEDIRGSGRTTKMLNEVYKAIKNGQPLCRVVFSSVRMAGFGRNKFLYDIVGPEDRSVMEIFEFKVIYKGSEVVFHSANRLNYLRKQYCHDCFFVDHSV